MNLYESVTNNLKEYDKELYPEDIPNHDIYCGNCTKDMDLAESDESTISKEDFDNKCKELGITLVSPLYYVNGAPDCHSIEQADAYYNSLPSYSSVNYIKDKGDLTPEQFKFLDANRKYVSQELSDFSKQMSDSGSLD